MTADHSSSVLTELYSVTNLPVFQNRMFHSRDAAVNCTKGDVILVQDGATGLIFNRGFRPELMQYDADYQNEQAVSSAFRQHLQDVEGVVRRHFGAHSLIEVGCGKGHFLEQLQAAGFQITGLDPTYEGTNPAVIKEYFSPEIGLHAEAIVLRHVLEHVQDPVAFLARICQANGGHGKIYIEVPCFDWICAHRAWFDIFYEHVNYFRLADFHRMFGTVLESGRLFGGQYLFVVADLASLREPIYSEAALFPFPEDFQASVSRHAERLRAQPSGTCAIWGGASKGVIFALLLRRAGVDVDMVIDINPAKHGKYLPATGLQVRSPEEGLRMLAPHADIVVMNGNYLEEIKQTTGNRFNYLTVDHENI
jgi:hypothetical protein